MKQIHLLLGGMTGGPLDRLPPSNTGMFALKRMLAPRLVTDWTWGDWMRCVDDIRANYKEGNQVVLIGYSGGGSRGCYATRMLASVAPVIPVTLLVAYDPSPADQMLGLADNVQSACCYYNERPMMWWPGVGRLGGGRLFAVEQRSPPVIETMTVRQQHLLVQFDQELHRRTIALIDALPDQR